MSTTERRAKGAGHIDTKGYVQHKRGGLRQSEHVRVAERALGKRLPRGAVVHHWDENPSNNEPDNLLICSRAYHQSLHIRMRALAQCGHAHWRKCCRCHEYADPADLVIRQQHAFHAACEARYQHAYRSLHKGKRKCNPTSLP